MTLRARRVRTERAVPETYSSPWDYRGPTDTFRDSWEPHRSELSGSTRRL